MRRLLCTMVLGATLALALPATAALATAPGTNGPIAFRRYLGPDRTQGAIFIAAPDGSGERQLTHPTKRQSDDYPDVAPDGTWVAFERCQPGCGIFRVNADGTGLRRIDHGCPPGRLPPRCVESSYAAISPDGTEIAFQRAFGRIRHDQIDHQGIYRMRLDGTHVRRVSLPAKRAAEDTQPQWSPDGTKIVFTRFNYGATRPRGGEALFTVNADGSGRRKLTPWSLRAGDGPDWSPDGTQILFRSPDTEDFLDCDLWTIRPDGSGLRQVTHLAHGTKLYSASFSPSGTAVAFGMTGVDGQADVWRMGLDGTGLAPVTRTAQWDSAPDWGAGS
jgi:TolB protein